MLEEEAPSSGNGGLFVSELGESAVASVVQLQEFQELPDRVAVLGGVTHGYVGLDAIAVSTADPFALDVSRSRSGRRRCAGLLAR